MVIREDMPINFVTSSGKHIKVKPCLFCGCENWIVEKQDKYERYWAVRCYNLNCYARGPKRRYKAQAVKEWNLVKRTGDTD